MKDYEKTAPALARKGGGETGCMGMAIMIAVMAAIVWWCCR